MVAVAAAKGVVCDTRVQVVVVGLLQQTHTQQTQMQQSR
jgi:hypothetical protein